MPILTVTLPDGQKLSHELTDEITTVGRAEDNVLQIPDGSVSSRHAEIVHRDEKYYLKDLNSTNGTTVNGRTVMETPLGGSDRIQFGDIHAIYDSEVGGEKRTLPTEERNEIVVANSSATPGDFTSAAPFPKKDKKKDPVVQAILTLAIIALIVGCAVIFYVMQMMRAPSF